jgi:peptidoglycan/LPS O-acetylase OafA/YrhL
MSEENTSPLKYMPQLDGLRAVAVFLVFIHHWTTWHLDTGQIGVQLFFVLSGFLITGILLDLRTKGARVGQSTLLSLRQFYGRRFLRIFPLFYGTLALLYVFDLSLVREFIGWHVTYLSNVGFALKGEFMGRTSHFWTLAVEEQFYLIWPLLILTAPRRNLLPVIVGAILLAPLCRMGLYASGYTNFVTYNLWPVSNLDTLGLGSLIALLIRRDEWSVLWERYLKYGLLAGIPIYLAIRFGGWPAEGALQLVPMLQQTALALGLGWIVVTASYGFEGAVGTMLEWQPIVYLGKISYGLYVFHNFAPDVLRNIETVFNLSFSLRSGALGFLLSFCLTVAVSAASWHFYERPINSLKSHCPYIVTPGGTPSPSEADSQHQVEG